MRGADRRSGELFSYVGLDLRVRADHPLHAIRAVVNEALDALSGEFAALYSSMGRPSIPPEMLLRAMLLQAFYSVRSKRQLMERLEFDLLFRWIVGLGVDEPAWDHSTFSKNHDRLLDGDRRRGLQPDPIAEAARSASMSVAGKWRIIEMPGYPADYPDLIEPAYILFDHGGGGEFAFGACTGHIWEASRADATGIDFSWDGSDEMDQVCGDGHAELRSDGSLQGEIRYRNGDDLPFIAKRWTSSTAC